MTTKDSVVAAKEVVREIDRVNRGVRVSGGRHIPFRLKGPTVKNPSALGRRLRATVTGGTLAMACANGIGEGGRRLTDKTIARIPKYRIPRDYTNGYGVKVGGVRVGGANAHKWIDHAKLYAKEHNITYAKALRAARSTYKK